MVRGSHAIFGGIILTTILLTIGVLGWTFEALCVSVCTGHDRWNIKKSMRRMEDEGILQGERPRGPGFRARVVTISDAFPEKRELEAVLRAYVKVWPQFKNEVEVAMRRFPPRTKEHLRRRELWPYN